jgi:hypothetical protein
LSGSPPPSITARPLDDYPLEDNVPLWYADPTGAAAVRHLTPGEYIITGPDGLRITVDAESIAPALELYDFYLTRRGKGLRGRLKKKTPDAWQGIEGNAFHPPTAK